MGSLFHYMVSKHSSQSFIRIRDPKVKISVLVNLLELSLSRPNEVEPKQSFYTCIAKPKPTSLIRKFELPIHMNTSFSGAQKALITPQALCSSIPTLIPRNRSCGQDESPSEQLFNECHGTYGTLSHALAVRGSRDDALNFPLSLVQSS